MREQIKHSLERNFLRHRIVVWNDPDTRFEEDFAEIDVAGAKKLKVDRNEFAIKHQVLLDDPGSHFLIYRPGPTPSDEDNWLLDLEMGYGRFNADKADMVRSELNLPPRYADLIQDHLTFFASTKRLEALKAVVTNEDGAAELQLHMLAICAGAKSHIDAVLEALFSDMLREKDSAWTLIQKSGLEEPFWGRMKARFGYESDNPSLIDLAEALFWGAYRLAFQDTTHILPEASVFLNRWSNMIGTRPDFQAISERMADALNVAADLPSRDFEAIVDLHLFEEIDKVLLALLAERVSNRDIPYEDVRRVVQARRTSMWYESYKHGFEALLCASELQSKLNAAQYGDMTLESGLEAYAKTWYRIDQLYRKFTFHRGKYAESDLLSGLVTAIEHLYTSEFIPRLNAGWQKGIDAVESWQSARIVLQRRFFEAHVAPIRKRKSKVVVIISDALRYEAGEQFYRQIQRLSRFDAKLSPMLGAIPSYTQLGMAALLPNRDLRIDPDSTVKVDHLSATGTKNRLAILEAGAAGDKVLAIQAADVDQMDGPELRMMVKDNDIIYIYQNIIDAQGDTPAAERETCGAVELAIERLEALVKRLTGNNVNNVLVTSDHGFLFQSHDVHIGDFVTADIDGQKITEEKQRFVLGVDLHAVSGLEHFTPKRAGIEGNMDILTPRGVERLGRKGRGSQFVHGGTSLQEVVVPVIAINKQRTDDLQQVSVDVISAGSKVITTGQHNVRLYQAEPATEKRKALQLIIGFEGPDGVLISNQETRIFDFTSSEAKERETTVRLILSREAEAYNNGSIRLVLKYADHKGVGDGIYKSDTYTYRRLMGGGDFDL